MQVTKKNPSSKTFALLALSLIAASSAAALANPRTFEIADPNKRDLVSFNSDAPIELIVGNTNAIKGNVVIDDSLSLTKTLPQATFTVDLATIDTGIALRNEHMRDNFLETKKFPEASFTLKKLVSPPKALKAGQKIKIMAQGDFKCHGKTVSKVIPLEVTYLPKCPQTEAKIPDCDLIQIRATFPVVLQEHDIKRPEVVFQKLADKVIVTVAATAFSKNSTKTEVPAKKAK